MLAQGLDEPSHLQEVARAELHLAGGRVALGEPPLEQARPAQGERGDVDGLVKPLEQVLVVGVPADALIRTIVEVDEAGVERARGGEGPPHHFPEKRIGVCGRMRLMSAVAVAASAGLLDKPEGTAAPKVGPVRDRHESVPQGAEDFRRYGPRLIGQRATGGEGSVIEQLERPLATAPQDGTPPRG